MYFNKKYMKFKVSSPLLNVNISFTFLKSHSAYSYHVSVTVLLRNLEAPHTHTHTVFTSAAVILRINLWGREWIILLTIWFSGIISPRLESLLTYKEFTISLIIFHPKGLKLCTQILKFGVTLWYLYLYWWFGNALRENICMMNMNFVILEKL